MNRLKYQRIHSKKFLTSSDQTPNLEATNPEFISKNLHKPHLFENQNRQKNANIFFIFTKKSLQK